MLRAMASGALQDYVVRRGGANALFFNGVKQTSQIDLSVGGFTGSLVPTVYDRVSVLVNGNILTPSSFINSHTGINAVGRTEQACEKYKEYPRVT